MSPPPVYHIRPYACLWPTHSSTVQIVVSVHKEHKSLHQTLISLFISTGLRISTEWKKRQCIRSNICGDDGGQLICPNGIEVNSLLRQCNTVRHVSKGSVSYKQSTKHHDLVWMIILLTYVGLHQNFLIEDIVKLIRLLNF